MTAIRIVLVDDHRLVRAGIRALLEGLDALEVVGDASDGLEALVLVETLRPEILLTDISMPRLNGLELVQRVSTEFPETRSIILSMHAEVEYATKAIRAGARGYLLKDSGKPELEMAIRAVARGESYLSPAVSTQVIAEYVKLKDARLAAQDPLTHRQREVLKLIAEGHTTRSLAQQLDISVKTADTHRVQLMERLGIHDIAGLVRYAIRTGLIDAEK